MLAVLPANATSVVTIVAWGDNSYGQTTIPPDLSGVTAVSAGYFHVVALKSDGTVVAWGGNTDEAARRFYGQATVPAGLTEVKAISAGGFHTVALKNDGTVVAWGAGMTDTACFSDCGQSIVPAGLGGVTAIAAGRYHTVALTSGGTVVAWGAVGYDVGQTSVPAGLSGVTAIAAGPYHNLALKNDGTVVAWGWNDYGQTNIPAGLSDVKAIAAGFRFSVALKNDGTVVAWGGEGYESVPAGLSGVTAIAANFYDTQALKSDGTVVTWGLNALGAGNTPAGLSGVTAIAAGYFHTVALIATDTDNTPPVLNLPASFAVDATSPEGAAVNYTVTATDNSGIAPTVSCIPMSGLTFAIGPTIVNCTATDAATNSAKGNFTVTVNGPVTLLENLISLVGSFNNPFGITNSLDTKLQHAINALDGMKGNSASIACNSLGAFINEARAQSGQKLTVGQANLLIESANRIRAALGCP